jgi:hypothetical protein
MCAIMLTSPQFGAQVHLYLDSGNEEIFNIFNRYYVPSKIDALASHGRYEGIFRDQLITKLCQLSKGNFLWADIACQAITRDFPWHAIDNLNIPLSVDKLYVYMKDKLEALADGNRQYCFRVLMAMAIAFRPLSISELAKIVNMPAHVDLAIMVREQWFAFLMLFDERIHFTHHSAKACIQQYMHHKIAQQNSRVVEHSLESLARIQGTLATHSDFGEEDKVSMKYAAVYWIQHILKSEESKWEAVCDFLTVHPLRWVDLLALEDQTSSVWMQMR